MAKRSNRGRGFRVIAGGKRRRARRRGWRLSWGELRLVLLGGVLAGLSLAAMPDEWRGREAFAALPEGIAEAVSGGVALPEFDGAGLVEAAAAEARAARRFVGEAVVGDGAAGDGVAGGGAAERAHGRFARCSGAVRVNCVVDGDTFWMDGEKIRIADLNAPEVSRPRCAAEARLGARATDALIVQLNAGPFALEAIDRDEDRYGRKLRRVTRGGDSVGEAMVSAGVARWYDEGRRGWC